MAMKILKRGTRTKFRGSCDSCGCEFLFGAEHTKNMYCSKGKHGTSKVAFCPGCYRITELRYDTGEQE